MWTKSALSGLILWCTPLVAVGQDAPLSVIDWLSESVATPVAMPAPQKQADIAASALPESVTVIPLDGPQADGIGLLNSAQTGLPVDLWAGSSSAEIAARIADLNGDMLPATRALFIDILLSELNPPADASPPGMLFLARIDALLQQGYLTQADALLTRAGQPGPEAFRRWFDINLLTGSENQSCTQLHESPDLSPTFPARIYCLARRGDWDAAALTLETAKALGILSPHEDALLARFLHADLAEDTAAPSPPELPSPLIFRLYEAIGEALPTDGLPLAYAHSDLRDTTGWKDQIEAAERLARVGAVPPETLAALYSERLPAASGGVWDRVEAFQRFDTAMKRRDPGAVSASLANVWRAMEAVELEVPFAALYGADLARLPLTGPAGDLAFRIGLLSPDFERVAVARNPANGSERFLIGLARGDLAGTVAPDDHADALARGFQAGAAPEQLQSLVDQRRMGEAILRALALMTTGAQGELAELTDATAFLRHIGLESTVRRTALQLMLLERRG